MEVRLRRPCRHFPDHPSLKRSPAVEAVVGGIPEQVQDSITGFLTPPGDAEAMAGRVVGLLEDEELRQRVGEQAAEDARNRFDLERQAQENLHWKHVKKK